jgi:hypothetical protein
MWGVGKFQVRVLKGAIRAVERRFSLPNERVHPCVNSAFRGSNLLPPASLTGNARRYTNYRSAVRRQIISAHDFLKLVTTV